MEDGLLEQPKKRARRGSKKSNGTAEGEPAAQNADRKTRGSAKGSAPKKNNKKAKKPRSSVKASPATDWDDSSQQDVASDSDMDVSSAYGSDSSDLEDDEFSVKNTARKQRAQGVRLNDEFHSLNNNLIGFPEEERTQARITYSQTELAIQSWNLRMEISSEYVALIAQSYAVLRAFSWQLRMAPFPIEALLVALATPQDSALRDEVHICLLRTLAWHDSTKLRAKRKLDFANLDHTTWKDFLWEFLRYAQQPAWWRAHVIHRAPEKPLVDLTSGHVRKVPKCTLLDTTDDATAAPEAANGASGAVKEEPKPAADEKDNGDQKPSSKDGKCRPEWLQRMHHLHNADYYPQRIGMRDYAELDPVERAKLLTFLTDVLLDQPHINAEIEHRVQAGRLHAGQGGEGGSWPSKIYTAEELAARREMDARGELVTEFAGCMLCLQEDGLVRCEACDARYHMSCLGYSSEPTSTWICPECHIGGRGECAGARVAMTAMQPGRIPLYLMNGNVLRVAHPGQCYVEEDEDMVDCGLQFLQGDKAMEAMKISKRKGGDTGCHPTAPDMLVVQCSSAVLDDGGNQPESITPPFCTPWTYTNAYGFSWPEACAQLALAVEDSRKQKRRGTPNAVVLAGMSMPAPFETPVQMPKSHVKLLHALRREVRARAELPALKSEVKDEGPAMEGALLPLSKALSHAALNPPEGHISQLEALRHYLLQVENQLYGVLDRGWTEGFEFRKRFLANILEARTPLLLARLLLVLVDAIRPSVAERIFTKEWTFMDVDLCPGGFAILDPAARAEAQRAEAQNAAAAEAEEVPGAAYIGRTTARSAQAAAQAAAAAEAAAAQGLDYACRADTRVRDRDRERERRRRRGQDDDAEPLEPFIATPFADDEIDEAPSTGLVCVEPGAEFGRLVHELPPVTQDSGFEGAVSRRDPSSGNKRKRPRTKRPTKAAVAAAVASASADGAATGPTGAAAVSAATGSALSQRRRFIMNLTEAKSIGKRPSPQFTNYSFFKSQAARVLPLERLPGQQVRQAGRQGGRVPIIGMVYPRQNTAHSAVARLGLSTLKWRGLLENAVSLSQVSIAFRHFEECLTLAQLDMAWLDEPPNAILRNTQILDRRMIMEELPALPPGPELGLEAPSSTPPKIRTWHYLCAVSSPENPAPAQVQVPASVDAALRGGNPPQHPPPQAHLVAPPQAHAAQAQLQAAQAQIAIMARIVMSLQQSPHAGPFLEPVPGEVEGYHELIRHPMDLGTITTKLQRGMYPSVQHIHQDIMLMIQNCYTFNTEGSDIYVCAQHVEHAYRRLCTEGGLM